MPAVIKSQQKWRRRRRGSASALPYRRPAVPTPFRRKLVVRARCLHNILFCVGPRTGVVYAQACIYKYNVRCTHTHTYIYIHRNRYIIQSWLVCSAVIVRWQYIIIWYITRARVCVYNMM